MIKNTKDNNKNKQNKLNRSRSKSPQRSKSNISPKNSKKQVLKGSPNKKNQKGSNNPSLMKSLSKKSLKSSRVDKKTLKKNLSQPKLSNSSSLKDLNKSRKQPQLLKSKAIPPKDKLKQKQLPKLQQSQSNNIKAEEKEMGLIFFKPEHDKIIFKPLDITDEVFDKYLEMINNDNDTSYVMNALPELNSFKKQDETDGRDFVSGRISRLSGIFDHLSVDKIITPMKKVPNYYQGPCGKNLSFMKVMLQTKFKVEVDLGFLQYSMDGDKLTIFRVYMSKIYRRMNYICFAYLQMFKALMQKHPGADRWSIFILEKNVGVHKFFKYMGFKIQKIATQSKNKSVDYFQEFTIKKKDLQTVIASMAK